MATPEMQKAISRLRLTLASIRGKEDELERFIQEASARAGEAITEGRSASGLRG